jgi:hypothetical protein
MLTSAFQKTATASFNLQVHTYELVHIDVGGANRVIQKQRSSTDYETECYFCTFSFIFSITFVCFYYFHPLTKRRVEISFWTHNSLQAFSVCIFPRLVWWITRPIFTKLRLNVCTSFRHCWTDLFAVTHNAQICSEVTQICMLCHLSYLLSFTWFSFGSCKGDIKHLQTHWLTYTNAALTYVGIQEHVGEGWFWRLYIYPL